MASVHFGTETPESFVVSSNNLAEATKLSGPIIKVPGIFESLPGAWTY